MISSKIPYMYPEDEEHAYWKLDDGTWHQAEDLTVFICPYCGHESKALLDSHDDFICDCNESLFPGVNNLGEDTDFDKLMEQMSFDETKFDRAVDMIAAILYPGLNPASGQGKFWMRYNEWKRQSQD